MIFEVAYQQKKFNMFCKIHGFVKKIQPWGILIAAIALVLSVVQFWIEFDDRVKEREVRAWQLVTTIAPGNSGKIEALNFLNSEHGIFCFDWLRDKLGWLHGDIDTKCLILFKPRTSLVGINLSAPVNSIENDSVDHSHGVYLARVDLRGATLSFANLRGAILVFARLSAAVLYDANLRETNLIFADLTGADLSSADLTGADLFHADLSEATLADTDLAFSNLTDAKLVNADLTRVDISDANLTDTDLSGTNLSGVDLRHASYLTSEQIDMACGDSSTKLPNKLTVRDCGETVQKSLLKSSFILNKYQSYLR